MRFLLDCYVERVIESDLSLLISQVRDANPFGSKPPRIGRRLAGVLLYSCADCSFFDSFM